MKFSRRLFLRSTVCGAALGGATFLWPGRCLWAQEESSEEGGLGAYGDYDGQAPLPRGGGDYGSTTSADIEGPFYRSGAPFRGTLAPEDEPGRPLLVTGRVVAGLECTPMPGAVVDLWQASSTGRYDNDDRRRPPTGFHLRGRVKTDDAARFSFRTIWPGNYQIGPDRWRPAHLHVKASAEGCAELTTQLYFEGDEHNAKDPWFDASRMLTPEQDEEGVWVAHYEIVLTRS